MTHSVVLRSPKLSGRARKFCRDYRRVVLLEHEGDEPPRKIARNCRKILSILHDETVYIGKTERSYGYRLVNELEVRRDDLNTVEESSSC